MPVKPSSWLVERWPAFLEKLHEAYPDQDSVAAVWNEEKNYWKERFAASPTSMKNPYKWTNAYISEHVADEDEREFYKVHVNFSRPEWDWINGKTAVSISERQADIQYLRNVQSIVDAGVSLLERPLWEDIALGIAVLTGRRVSEVLETAVFTPCTEYSVIFSGQLKQGEHLIEYEIPTLCKAQLVIDALARLRALPLPSDTGNNPRNVRLVAKKFFKGLIPTRPGKEIDTRMFRAIYTRLAIYFFCPPSVGVMRYAATIEGHRSFIAQEDVEAQDKTVDSYRSSVNYMDYEVEDPERPGYPDGRRGVRLYDSGVCLLGVFKDASLPPKLSGVPLPTQSQKTAVVAPSSFNREDTNNAIAFLGALPESVQTAIEKTMIISHTPDPVEWLLQAVQQRVNYLSGRNHASADNIESLSTTDLKNIKTAQSRNEFFRRAVEAVEENNKVCVSPMERWFLNAWSIQKLTGSRLPFVTAYIAEHKEEIRAINARHNLTEKYNHKPVNIEDVIKV